MIFEDKVNQLSDTSERIDKVTRDLYESKLDKINQLNMISNKLYAEIEKRDFSKLSTNNLLKLTSLISNSLVKSQPTFEIRHELSEYNYKSLKI